MTVEHEVRRGVPVARTKGLGPSAPWVAVAATLMALASFAWWLLYTWNVIPAMDRLGAWNYLGSIGAILVAAVLMRFWRGA